MISKKVQNYINMYKSGHSSYEIARKFNVSRSNVCSLLKRHGIQRRHLGDDVELEVMNFLIDKGKRVEHLEGNSPYDLLVNGKKIDVKSASLSYDKWNKKNSYVFQLQDRWNRTESKDLQNKVDYFYLVFLSIENRPIYILDSKDVEAKQTLRIYEHLKTKYPIKLLGYLN